MNGPSFSSMEISRTSAFTPESCTSALLNYDEGIENVTSASAVQRIAISVDRHLRSLTIELYKAKTSIRSKGGGMTWQLYTPV